MLVTIFGFLPPYRLLLKSRFRDAIASRLGVPAHSVSIAFSDTPIRPPHYHGPIRILSTGEDAWRREQKIDEIIADVCEEFFVPEGGYAYNFWFGCEQPFIANQKED